MIHQMVQGLDLYDDTVRRSLQRQELQAYMKTKKPLMTKSIEHVGICGQSSEGTQPGWIGVMSFFQTSQNSIFLAQMGNNVVGEGAKSIFWTSICNLLSNMGERAL
jgi:hypothetical protein